MKRFLGAVRTEKVTLLAVGLTLTFVLASVAVAGRGVGGTFHLGKTNKVNRVTELKGRVEGPTLRLNNNSAITNATALALKVEPGLPPMKVDSSTTVANLSSDLVDGMDSSAFAPANTNEFLRNNTYRVESTVDAGLLLGDGTFSASVSCNSGDKLLSGGPANVAPTSDMIESFPSSTTTWGARIDKNAQTDNWNVVALCANQ